MSKQENSGWGGYNIGNEPLRSDGSPGGTPNELDATLLNIIRVGANKENLLAAYRAQKKCYKICKKMTKRIDYREYVQGLQLDNYPAEFRKAELGRSYRKQFWWLLLLIPTFGSALLLAPLFFGKLKQLSNAIRNAEQ